MRPVVGTTLGIHETEGPPERRHTVRRLRAGKDGGFNFRVAPKTTDLLLELSADGYLAQTRQLLTGNLAGELIEVTLHRPGRLIVDVTGQNPRTDAVLWAIGPDGSTAFLDSSRTGRFEVGDLPPGESTLLVMPIHPYKPGGAAILKCCIVEGGTTEVAVPVAEARGRITGSVRDNSGLAVVGQEVRLEYRPPEYRGDPRWRACPECFGVTGRAVRGGGWGVSAPGQARPGGAPFYYMTQTDGDGRFSFWNHVERGTLVVPDGADAVVREFWARECPVDLVVPGRTAKGGIRFSSSDGRKLEQRWAQLVLHRGPDPVVLPRLVSAPDGTIAVGDLGPGRYYYELGVHVAAAAGYVDVVPGNVSAVVVAPSRVETIRVRVMDAASGEVPKGAKVTRHVGPARIATAVPHAEDGIAELVLVPPGQYEVQVEAPGYESWSGTARVASGETSDLGIAALHRKP